MVDGWPQMNQSTDNDKDSMAIAEIVKLLLKEVQIPTLQSIPFDTYQKIATTIENLEVKGYEGIESRIRDTLVETISTATIFLLEIRHHKILEKTSASTPNSTTTTTGIDYSKLTEEEKYMLDAEKESERRRNDVIAAILRGRPKVLESISKRVRSKHIIIRFLKPMEKFIGVDLQAYGPFRQEDVAVVPSENARSLIENNHAIEVQSIYQ
jgi:DNA replication factor GINS